MKRPENKTKRRITAYDVALVGVLSAFMVISQVVLAGLPNIELVSLLVLVYTLHFKRHTPYIIYVFVLAEGLLYGFHLWWVAYLYVWLILHLAVRFFSHDGENGALFWAFLSGIFGLCFGALCSFPYFFVRGIGGGIAYLVAGLPFDFLHCAGNFAAALLLFVPLNKAFGYYKKRDGKRA